LSSRKNAAGATHAGAGENVWSNVHIDDLVALYVLAIESAPPGAFLFAENGENSMREVCEAINRMLGYAGPPSAMSMEEAAAEWGEGTARTPWRPTAGCARFGRGSSAGSRKREG